MKTLFLAWFLLISGSTLAQTARTDVLHRLDQTTVNVKIDELTDTEVIYFESVAPKEKKRMARSQVWKIVFSDGSTETITARPGQTPDTDQITLVDQTVVAAKIGRRDDRKLYYTKLNDPTNTQYELLLNRLDRIRYADGREEVFRKTPGPQPAAPSEPVGARQESVSQPADYSAPSKSASYTDPQGFARLHLTVGPEFTYFPASINKQWGDATSGVGMDQNIGGSLRLDFRIIRSIAISLTGGYARWELVRNYLQIGTKKYDETIQLTRIPLQAGLKLYAKKGFYLMPEGGINLLTSSIKTSASHPSPDNQSSKSTPVTYGASIGYEIRAGGLLIDLSGRYQFLDIKNLNFGTIAPTLSERIQFASLRLGIGFNALYK